MNVHLRRAFAVAVAGLLTYGGVALTLNASADETTGQTVGDGVTPAEGPGPSEDYGAGSFDLIKNWDFGADGTIRTIDEMSAEFDYHDQFGTFSNGTNYGSDTVAPDAATAISSGKGAQPVEGRNTDRPVREFAGDSLRTFLVPIDGATVAKPSTGLNPVGNGSFMAKFRVDADQVGERDILWETKVRYRVPLYHWFALWNAGNKWDGGAEFDVIESFGFDHDEGNAGGRFWHSDPVGAEGRISYDSHPKGMERAGVIKGPENPPLEPGQPEPPAAYDATEYHTWGMLYRTDGTFSFYVDGIETQSGTMNWTVGGQAGGEKIDFEFLFDAGWGHTQVPDVNKELPMADLADSFYEFDWSRVYLGRTDGVNPGPSGQPS